MKVRELIKELQKQDPEAKVLNYVEEAEEYGETSKVIEIINQDDMPYSKGDTPKVKNKIVLIQGWIAF